MSHTVEVKTHFARLLSAGFFHVFGSNVLNKIIAFVTNILIVRFLTNNEYGLFSYAYSIYSIVLLFTGLGALSGILQYCSERRPEKEKRAYRRYGLKTGILIDAVLSIGLFATGCLIAFPLEGAGRYVAMLAPLLLLDYLFQYKCIVLRTEKKNKQYSYAQCVNTASYCLLGCLGAYLGGIAGTILGRYGAYFISLLFLSMLQCSRTLSDGGIVGLCRRDKTEFWRYSIGTGLAGIMLQMTYQIDVLVVGQLLATSVDVANYKVATLLPEGFLFIPSSVMVFAMPYFIEHREDVRWFGRRAIQLYSATEALMAMVALILIVFAPTIISILWGDIYLDAVLPFRIMAASLLVSPLRTICANLMAALRETKANLFITSITFIANIFFTIWLTIEFGITGAACAVVASSAIASIGSCVVLFRHLCNSQRYEGV